MCGIAASFPADERFVTQAIRRMAERGPDSAGMVRVGDVCLGATRLATTGLTAGSQPRVSADGRKAAALNGQIYNFRDLIESHGASGPTSDFDILLPLFEECGLDFASRLRGMFSAIVAEPQRIVATTDQFGLKPLYWAQDPTIGCHYFASVLQAFPDDLRRRAVRLPPGATITTDGEFLELGLPQTNTCNPLSTGPSLRWTDLLEAACLEQVPRELPFAILLSGGVDSSLLSAILSKHFHSLTTVTCGLAGAPDFAYARRVAELIGSDHIEVVIDDAELPALMQQVVLATASFEPFLVAGGIPTFVAARALHAEGYRVAISGEGADELFGGYDEFSEVPPTLLERALRAQQHDLGATEALRLDRCTMSWSVECRIPYLDQRVVSAVRALPVGAKRGSRELKAVNKVALREFAASLLPSDIAWREKVGFTVGSGVASRLAALADSITALPQPSTEALYGYAAKTPLERWLLSEWLKSFGDSIAESWDELQNRGLVRQAFNLYSFSGP